MYTHRRFPINAEAEDLAATNPISLSIHIYVYTYLYNMI